MELAKQSGDDGGYTEDTVPTYGLLVINHAYNEGKITFQKWLELSRQWAEKILQRYDGDVTE